MRVVELSNHPGDMLSDAARRRRGAERRVLSVYEDELVRYRARVQAARSTTCCWARGACSRSR